MNTADDRAKRRLAKSRRQKRYWWIGGVIVLLIAVVLLGRGWAGRQAQRAAEREIRAGAVSEAEKWLAWAARIDADDFRNDLLLAACFRALGERENWERSVDAAEERHADRDALRLEKNLGELRWGEAQNVRLEDVDALVEAGAPPGDSVAAVVYGLLAQGDVETARQALAAWQPEEVDEAQAAHLRGMCDWTADDRDSAQMEFELAVKRQPRHEPARAGLGRIFEQREQIEQALPHYLQLFQAAPQRETAQVDLARVLRKLGRSGEARQVLPAPLSPAGVSRQVAVELAERAYEEGDYEQARQWFVQADIEAAHVADTLRAAASAFALGGDTGESQRQFARIDHAQAAARHVSELQRRLQIDPGDRIAAAELKRALESAGQSPRRTSDPLYAEHCAACHGDRGDGRGRAARFLFPRPRDFRHSRQRLVSTTGQVAAIEDIERVIARGVPGTAMPSFDQLSPEQRRRLAERVRQFRREGLREQLLAAQGDDASSNAGGDKPIEQRLAELMADGEALVVPHIEAPDDLAIARGRDLYLRLGCSQCHGDDGSGQADLLLLDDAGQRSTPRDLVWEPMKGGAEPDELFRRIRLGMPGAPHPATTAVDEDDVIALVHYCRSLSQEPKKTLGNHERWLRAAGGSLEER